MKRKKENITNSYLVMNFYITGKEEKKSNKIKDGVRNAVINLTVQQVGLKALPHIQQIGSKVLAYVQQFLLSVLSCFTPGGYVVPQVEQYQEQTVTVTDPDYIPLQSEDGRVMFLQYAK